MSKFHTDYYGTHVKFTEYPKFGILSSVKVVTTGINIAGPFAGSFMSEMGAQVVQIEHPLQPCSTRGNYGYAQDHRNGFSLGLNTHSPKGVEVFKKLLGWADLWIESGRPGTYAKMGLTDEFIWENINPKLSIVHVSGYGQFGPYKNKASYDVSGQAMGGYMYMNGVSPESGPLKVNPYLSDYVTAYNACICALAGHIHALKWGEGDSADVAQYDNMFRLLDNYPTVWFNKEMPKNGEPVKLRTGNKHDMSACFSFYDTADGGAIFVAIVGQGPVERGYPIIGMGKVGEGDIPAGCTGFPLFDPRGAKAEKLMEEFCAARTAKELEEIFEAAGIPNQRCYGPEDIINDPQFEARENIIEWEDAVFGKMKGIGLINRFKKNPSKVVGTAPTFGEHNREVLTAFGYSAEEIDDMFAKREMNYWSAKDTAVNKALAAWGFFWSKEQSERLGL